MTNLTSPLIGLLFLQKISTILDMRQRIVDFFFFSRQLKYADNTSSYINGVLLNPTYVFFQPGNQTLIYIMSQVSTESEVRGIFQPYYYPQNNDDLIICPMLTTTQNKQFTPLNNSFLEHP